MTDPRPPAPHAIIERFSFRANGREVVEDVDVAPEAPRTLIPPRVAAALGLGPSAGMLVDPDGALSDGAVVGGPTRRCVVAWTLYEAEGYHSRLTVVLSLPRSNGRGV